MGSALEVSMHVKPGLVLAVVVILGVGLPAVLADEPPPVPGPRADVKPPEEAWNDLGKAVRELPRAEQRAGRVRLAAAYLDDYDLSGKKPEGGDWLYLGMLQVAADRAHAAYTCFHAAMTQGDLDKTDKALAGRSIARLLANTTHCAELDGKACTKEAVGIVQDWLGEDPSGETASLCAAAHMSLGGFFARAHELDDSIEHYLSGARLEARNANTAGRSIARALMGSTSDLDAYPKLLERATVVHAELVDLAEKALAEAKEMQIAVEADAEATDAQKQMADRRLKAAERDVERLGRMLQPFEMLGTPAPAWTVDHAFGATSQLSQLRGKVVLLDFWATWCPWCIRSFPAIRDLLRDYKKQGFEVVGVTATADVVFDARYELDDDKQGEQDGTRSQPVARRARNDEPNPEEKRYADAEYREIEKKAIATFIDNHEMTWPVVMIEKSEPSAKFALTGWPHAVLIDRQGRVRYFKVGALLRDRKEQVKHFREVLEGLLAEGETPDK